MSHRIETMPDGYQGPFTVELTEAGLKNTAHVPSSFATIEGNKITVRIGRAVKGFGGLQFYAQEKPFGFGWHEMNRVLDSDNGVLWQNHHFKPA